MKLKFSLLLAGCLIGAASLSAQSLISFTFSGTATGDADGTETYLGYTSNQAVSFTFVIADNDPVFVDLNSGGGVRWEDFGQASQRLIQSVSGTGITGTWQAPVVNSGATRNSYFSVEHSPTERFTLTFAVWDYTEPVENISGLSANGYDLGQIMISAYDENPLGLGALPSSGGPFDLLTASMGTYDLSGSPLGASMYDIGDDNSLDFSITSITISEYSAVPEPSTYAAILGGLALVGVVAWRRRKQATDHSAV